MVNFTQEAKEWHDEYIVSKNKTIYTKDQLNIPGLSMIGHYYSQNTADPLVYHYHKDCIEITFLVKGNVNFAVEGKLFTLNGGDVFITPANLPHSTDNNPFGISKHYWMQINLADEPFLFLDPAWSSKLTADLSAQQTRLIRRNKSPLKQLETMFGLITSDNTNRRFQGLSLLIKLLHEVTDTINSNASNEANTLLPSNISAAIDWINEHIHEGINLEDVAKATHSSLSHFKSQFMKSVGMSPGTYINMQKIELAKELLLSGKPVAQVSELVGFSSSNYFSIVFRKFALMSPSEYVKASMKGS